MADLLDASVWVPLSAPDHEHHPRARRYWQSESGDQLAFCRVTALALLRHLTNAHVMQHAVLNSTEAWRQYRRWLALPEVGYLHEPDGVDEHLGKLSRTLQLGPLLWTDAYLAAFAMAGHHRIVTFDADFRRFRGLDLLHLQG